MQVDKEELVDSLFINYSYNDWKGNSREENFDNLDGAGRDITYKYDNRGNVIEECIYTVNGKFDSKSNYSYNSSGKIIEKRIFDSRDSLKDKVVYQSDNTGKIIVESFDNVKGTGREIRYKYDDSGNMIQRIDYGLGGNLIFKTIFRYNDIGFLIDKNRFDFYERCISKSQYQHDDDGNMIEEFIYGDKLADGGAAMTAYAKMQFMHISDVEHKGISAGLLKYCELDTMAMVFIWEYFKELTLGLAKIQSAK